jgi:hypothetical protein
VLDSAGAGISFAAPEKNWKAEYNSWVGFGDEKYWFNGSDEIQDVGTTCGNVSCSELLIQLFNIRREICEEINRIAGNNFTGIPTIPGTFCWDSFQGNFMCGPGAPYLMFNTPTLRGKMTTCVNDPNSGYTFTRVLLAR